MNSYRRLHEILSKLDQKRLIPGTLWSSSLNCGCAMGYVVPESERMTWVVVGDLRGEAERGEDGVEAFCYASTIKPLFGGKRVWRTPGIQAAMEREGFTIAFADEIETVNDDGGPDTGEEAEERYARVMAYLEARFDEPV